MNTTTTTIIKAATPTSVYHTLGDVEALATSLEATVSYLESCHEKHGEAGMAADYYTRAKTNCQRIANDLRLLKENDHALVRYRNTLYDLNEAQLAAFARIKIDYQARISGDFKPVTTNHLFAELQAIAFAIGAIEKPVCVGGVGLGLVPRLKNLETV